MTGKNIVLGVTGSIAAYKAAELASQLTQAGAKVQVVLSQGASHFVGPLTFQGLTQQPVHTSLWPTDTASESGVLASMAHIGLAQSADLVLIAPASANCLARLAAGMADDLLSTLVLVARCPVLLAPAMNPAMWSNTITQRNVQLLQRHGHRIIWPESGRMACEHVGEGRLPTTEILMARVQEALAIAPQDLTGRRLLVTAGPTREAIDPVRYMTNHSSGKMGYALAQAALDRGADVMLVTGPVQLAPPEGVQVEQVTTTQQMYEAATRLASECDAIIGAAAPADFRPTQLAAHKLKKVAGAGLDLRLEATPDILAALGQNKKPGQVLIAFAAETQNLVEHARTKLTAKHADAVVANDITTEHAGFNVETNIVTWVTLGGAEPWPLLSKAEVAHRILDKTLVLLKEKAQ